MADVLRNIRGAPAQLVNFGGDGGGGGAPAIGGRGGNGGAGGTYGGGDTFLECTSSSFTGDGDNGHDGEAGTNGSGMGKVVILGNVTVQATAVGIRLPSHGPSRNISVTGNLPVIGSLEQFLSRFTLVIGTNL